MKNRNGRLYLKKTIQPKSRYNLPQTYTDRKILKNLILIVITIYLIGCSLNQSTQRIDTSDRYYKAQVVIFDKEAYKKELEKYLGPNSPTALLPFEIEEECKIQIELFNIKGDLISIIFEGQLKPGFYRVLMTESNLDPGL